MQKEQREIDKKERRMEEKEEKKKMPVCKVLYIILSGLNSIVIFAAKILLNILVINKLSWTRTGSLYPSFQIFPSAGLGYLLTIWVKRSRLIDTGLFLQRIVERGIKKLCDPN